MDRSEYLMSPKTPHPYVMCPADTSGAVGAVKLFLFFERESRHFYVVPYVSPVLFPRSKGEKPPKGPCIGPDTRR